MVPVYLIFTSDYFHCSLYSSWSELPLIPHRYDALLPPKPLHMLFPLFGLILLYLSLKNSHLIFFLSLSLRPSKSLLCSHSTLYITLGNAYHTCSYMFNAYPPHLPPQISKLFLSYFPLLSPDASSTFLDIVVAQYIFVRLKGKPGLTFSFSGFQY